jgi:hypothetical protein
METPMYFLPNQVVDVTKPGQRRSLRMRLDHTAVVRIDSGYVHLTGWRIRKSDGVGLYWTSVYVSRDCVALI